MRRISSCAASIAFSALLLPLPGIALAGSLCLSDEPPSPFQASATLGDRLGDTGLVRITGGTGGASEYLSFLGSTSYVYGSFSGCGERLRFSIGDALNLSYSTASGTDPFERLAGRPRDAESFLDAEFESAVGELGRVGYTASLHTAAVEGAAMSDRVTGSRLWFSSADRRLSLSSELAVSASDTRGQAGTAQRHQISLVVAESAGSNLSTTLSFSRVDRDFMGRRSAATPDRQALGATANLHAGNAALSLTFRSTRDNLDEDRDRTTHFWRTVAAEGSYWLDRGPFLPDRIRLYANRTEQHEFVWGADGLDDPTDARRAVGFAMNWTDWLDRAAATSPGAVRLSADLFADRTTVGRPGSGGVATGADARLSFDLERLFAIPGHVGTSARLVGGDRLDDGLGWQWNLSAEVDCLALLFDTPSSRAAYLLGRFGSGVGDQAAELVIDYRGMLAAGIRF